MLPPALIMRVGVVTHNFVLQVASETGIPGALLLLSIIWISFRQVRLIRKRLIYNGSKEFAIVAGLEAAWISFFVGGQFLSVAFTMQIIFLTACSSIFWNSYIQGGFDYILTEDPRNAIL